MGNIVQRFDELHREVNQIFDGCKKSFKGQEDNKVVLTDKGGRKLAVIPFSKTLPYLHNFGAIYRLFGVTSMSDYGYDYLAVVCFDSASHFAFFDVDSLTLGKRFEIADTIADYKHRGKREYDYKETEAFIDTLVKREKKDAW